MPISALTSDCYNATLAPAVRQGRHIGFAMGSHEDLRSMQHNMIKVDVADQKKSFAREPLIASVVTVCHSVCPSLVQAEMVWPERATFMLLPMKTMRRARARRILFLLRFD